MVLPDISLASWAGLAAAATMLSAGWHNVRGWLASLMDFVVCRVAVKDEAARAVLSTVWANGRKSPFGYRVFGGWRTYIQPRKRVEVAAYETVAAVPVLYWVGCTPVVLKN